MQPIQLVNCVVEVTPAGKIPAGITDIPFELPLTPKPNRTLYETYHGVFVNISYMIRCEMKRSFLSKDHFKSQQFMVQYKVSEEQSYKSKCFELDNYFLGKSENRSKAC